MPAWLHLAVSRHQMQSTENSERLSRLTQPRCCIERIEDARPWLHYPKGPRGIDRKIQETKRPWLQSQQPLPSLCQATHPMNPEVAVPGSTAQQSYAATGKSPGRASGLRITWLNSSSPQRGSLTRRSRGVPAAHTVKCFGVSRSKLRTERDP